MKIGDLVKFSGHQYGHQLKEQVGVVIPRPAYLHDGFCGTLLVLWNDGKKTWCARSKLEVIK